MKFISIAIVIFTAICICGFTTNTQAQTSQEQLTQMVAQLQKTPADIALREKIIKLAATMKPTPAVPDEAIKYEGRAQFAFKNAKSEADFVSAAEEYEKAVSSAPWVAGYYSDLCTIYEKANKYTDAKRNCGFYLVSLTDANDITDLKRRIAGLDYGIEKSSPAAKAEREKKELVEKLKAFDGAVFVGAYKTFANGHRWRPKAKIVGQEIVIGSELRNGSDGLIEPELIFGEWFSQYIAKEIFRIDSLELKSPREHSCLVAGREAPYEKRVKIDLDLATVTIIWCFETDILRRQ
ncbi:MAG: hypothetical protein IPI64_05790 [Chloracidobacterium sp.]|nr:hypothetical protein [Chloracidobacterium sp.]